MEAARAEFLSQAKGWRIYKSDPSSPFIDDQVRNLLAQGVVGMMHNFLLADQLHKALLNNKEPDAKKKYDGFLNPEAEKKYNALLKNPYLAPAHLQRAPVRWLNPKQKEAMASQHRIKAAQEIAAIQLREELEHMPQICAYAAKDSHADKKKTYVCDMLLGSAIHAAAQAAEKAGIKYPHISTTYFAYEKKNKPVHVALSICKRIRDEQWHVDKDDPTSPLFDEKTLIAVHRGITRIIAKVLDIKNNKDNIRVDIYKYIKKGREAPSEASEPPSGESKQSPSEASKEKAYAASIDRYLHIAESAPALGLAGDLYDSPALAQYGQEDKDRIVKQLMGSLIKASLDKAFAMGVLDESKFATRYGIVPDSWVMQYTDIKLQKKDSDENRHR